MAAIPGIKYDDGLPGYSANCFPVRALLRQDAEEEADGAWLVAHRAEQRKRFKAILCTKPKTYARIKEERRRAEKQGTTISEQNADEQVEEAEKETPTLDGFFLMRHCCVEDPSDLCSVNISGCEITDVKEEDLALFDNVAYVNASENFLPLEAFRGFPILRELEMPLNGLRNVKPNIGDYPSLEVLDVSYNNLSHEDVLTIGLLQNLKVLHLTGNNFKSLPPNMAMPFVDDKSKTELMRFSKLEILLLDDNKLEEVSVFAALAGLSRLKHLNLEKNELYYVPMLKSVEGKVVPNDDQKEMRKLRRSARGSRMKKETPRHTDLEKKEKEESIVGAKHVPAPAAPTESMPEGDNASKAPDVPTNSEAQQDLMNEDLSDLSRQVTEIELEQEATATTLDNEIREPESRREQLGDGTNLPPFPDLRILNLAYNKIEDEEALLAVAAWPMLVDLIIHNNPLTTENSGDPPLLQRFLGERLGIKIRRKKEPEIVKPTVEVKLKKSRHVTSQVPKIPKLSVDDLLMLEAPRPPEQPKPPQELRRDKTRTPSNLDAQKPLPPIPGTPTGLRPGTDRSRTGAGVEDEGEDDTTRTAGGPARTGDDGFFMTQVDEQMEERPSRKEKRKKPKKEKKEEEIDDKYKGYEILLDAEADPNYYEPKDMQGNIKALKYALGHELVYRDPRARLDRISKPVEPYRKTELPKGSPRVTQAERKEEMLEEMRTRITTEEAGLQEVLTGNRALRRKFPDSDRLLTEIQRRYNAVRVSSMKDAKDARKVLAGTMQDFKKTEAGNRHVKMEV